MNSSRNSFEMVCFSRFIILQSVVTRYLFVQKVVNCCQDSINYEKEPSIIFQALKLVVNRVIAIYIHAFLKVYTVKFEIYNHPNSFLRLIPKSAESANLVLSAHH